jgi:phosphohistidine swiveling domain-containing protein
MPLHVVAIISGIPLVDRVPEETMRVLSGTLVEVDADRGLVQDFRRRLISG